MRKGKFRRRTGDTIVPKLRAAAYYHRNKKQRPSSSTVERQIPNQLHPQREYKEPKTTSRWTVNELALLGLIDHHSDGSTTLGSTTKATANNGTRRRRQTSCVVEDSQQQQTGVNGSNNRPLPPQEVAATRTTVASITPASSYCNVSTRSHACSSSTIDQTTLQQEAAVDELIRHDLLLEGKQEEETHALKQAPGTQHQQQLSEKTKKERPVVDGGETERWKAKHDELRLEKQRVEHTLSMRCGVQRSEIEALESSVAQIREEKDLAEKQNALLSTKLQEREKFVKELHSSLATERKENTTLAERLMEREKEMVELKANLAKATHEKEWAEKERADFIATDAKRKRTLTENVSNMADRLRKLEAENERLLTEVGSSYQLRKSAQLEKEVLLGWVSKVQKATPDRNKNGIEDNDKVLSGDGLVGGEFDSPPDQKKRKAEGELRTDVLAGGEFDPPPNQKKRKAEGDLHTEGLVAGESDSPPNEKKRKAEGDLRSGGLVGAELGSPPNQKKRKAEGGSRTEKKRKRQSKTLFQVMSKLLGLRS